MRYPVIGLTIVYLLLLACDNQSPGYSDAIRSLSSGYYHTCALKKDGTVWCWGSNFHLQLGDGLTAGHPCPEPSEPGEDCSVVPVQVANLSDVIQVSAGPTTSCALRAIGDIWCWGDGFFGALGDGTYEPREVPAQVTGLTGVAELAAGGGHHCARKTDGTVWCWGANSEGQLGDAVQDHQCAGETVEDDCSPVPVQVAGLDSSVSIASGSYHNCAIQADGSVWCWGSNIQGQVGSYEVDGFSGIPVLVDDLDRATAVAAGHWHSCALLEDSTVWCWGSNLYGQLGDDTDYLPRATSAPVTGLTDVTAISCGYWYCCGLKANGSVWCWGRGRSGQLGDGMEHLCPFAVDDCVIHPVQAVDLPAATLIASGGSHTCAAAEDGSVWCWGNNTFGQLGDGSQATTNLPVRVQSLTP